MATALKIAGDLIGINGNIISFDVGYVPPLEEGERYTLDIKKYKTNRSLEQNRLLWAVIQDISRHTGNDEMDVYISGLEAANVKYEYLLILPESLEALRSCMRAVKITGETRDVNDKVMLVVKAYIGSSKYDTAQMTQLIDHFIDIATDYGIQTGY